MAWTSELVLAGLIGGWILYELYGRQAVQLLMDWTPYIRMGGGVAVICALWWYARRSPENFQDTLGLAQQLMKEGSAAYVATAGKEKRNVSGLMKKKIAAGQQWKCGNCKATLDETYEVDHKLALFKGGSNDESNLVALCPNCHRKKTVEERLT
jgi:predicted HNH restriction endonuclease